MSDRVESVDRLSPWWRNAVVLVMVFGFTILIWRSVATYGYWHARGPLLLQQPTVRLVEWLRMPADIVFIGLGVVPLALASLIAYKATWRPRRAAQLS